MIYDKKWKLQLFADDPEPGEPDPKEPDPTDPGPKEPDPKEPEPREPEKKYTDDEVNEIVKKKIAAERAKAKKEADEAAKKAKMNAEEKQQYELQKANERIAELEAAELKHELSARAADLLKEEKIDATPEILHFVVGADEDATKENVDSFVSIIQAQLKAAEVERSKGSTPKKYDNPGSELTELDKRIAKYKAK